MNTDPETLDDIAGAAWEQTKTPLDRMYDTWQPGWEQAEMPAEFLTVKLVDQAGRPVTCSACGRDDRWAATEYGKWRCAGEHEPVWIGRGYIEQIIEVDPDQVRIG